MLTMMMVRGEIAMGCVVALAGFLVAQLCLGAGTPGLDTTALFEFDATGHLHINTTSADQDVFVNGVSVSQLARSVADLTQRLDELADAVSDADLPQLSADVAQLKESGDVGDVVDVQDGAAIVSAPNGVFLSANKTHDVFEEGGVWTPSELSVNVGDYVRFNWTSMDAVAEVEANGDAVMEGGYRSGNVTQGGESSVRLYEPREYRFMSMTSGDVVTVVAHAAGVAATSSEMQLGYQGEYGPLRIYGLAFGSCSDRLRVGAIDGSSSCSCKQGNLVTLAHTHNHFPINMYLCVG